MKLMEKTTQSEYLNELLTRAYDAEQGFHVAAELAGNKALSNWFEANSKQRLTFGHNLKRFLRDLDVEPDKGASLSGKIHQSFMKLRAAVTSEQDPALIEECRRGEMAALEDYKEALDSIEFRTDARKTLVDQKNHVEEQLHALDAIEKSIVAGS